MKIALVLGSGGARGYSHIGVIEEIKRRGHEIVAISGTSMGAVIGGMEAAGKLDKFADWATGLTQFDVLRLYDFALSQPGIIKADRIFHAIGSILEHIHIEDLDIPFTAVATDIVNHREVWFQRGSLEMAMRASCALPTFITPVMINGKILADGGLINPVPVEPTAAVPSDLTIAVSLSGRPNRIPAASAADAGRDSEQSDENRHGLADKLRRGVAGLIDVGLFWREEERQAEGDDPAVTTETPPDPEHADEENNEPLAKVPDALPTAVPTAPLYEMGKLPADLNTMGVVNMSLETMQAMIERFRAAASPVNLKIEIPAAVSGTLDFHKAPEIIEVGRQIASDVLDDAGL